MLSRFHLIPERYGRTDRQTDRQTDIFAISISRVNMLTRDKKRIISAIIIGIIMLLSFFFCIIHRIHSAGLTVDPPTKTLCQKLGVLQKVGVRTPLDPPVVAPLVYYIIDVGIMCVAASDPTIKSTVTDGCVLEGQNVSLTCQVRYNGTNLMPLMIKWYKLYASSDWYHYYHFHGRRYRTVVGTNTTNASSVHQSSLTFTATAADDNKYACIVGFSSPTGLVLRGVQKQYTNSPYISRYFTSSSFTPGTVASKIAVCL